MRINDKKLDSTNPISTTSNKKSLKASLNKIGHKVSEFAHKVFKSIINFFSFKKSKPLSQTVVVPSIPKPAIAKIARPILTPPKFEEEIALLQSTNENLDKLNAQIAFLIEIESQVSNAAQELEQQSARVNTPDTAGLNSFDAESEGFYLVGDIAYETEIVERFQRLEFNGPNDIACLLNVLTKNVNNEEIKDDDIIGFDHSLMVKKNGKPSSQNIKRDLEVFETLLVATYGISLANDIKSRYNLYKNAPNFEPLTLKKIKKCLVGVAANYTTNDLKDLFDTLKQKKTQSYFTAGARLSKQHVDLICRSNKFEDLKPEQLSLLSVAFTRLDGNTKGKIVNDVLTPEEGFYSHKGFFTLFNHDIKILKQNTITLPNELKNNKDLFMSEYFAKYTAYLELKAGMVIKLQDEQGNALQFYQVHNRLPNRGNDWWLGDSVFTHIITPINHSEKDFPIYVVPRGITREINLQGGFLQCVPRVLDPNGVGKTAFEERKNEIMGLILDTIKDVPSKNLILNITGHSMGGADSHRIYAQVIKTLSQKERPEYITNKKIKLNVTTHNPPYHEKSLADDFSRDFQNFLAIEETKDASQRITVSHTIVYYEGDPVQEKTPGVYLGGDIKSDLYEPKVILKTPKAGTAPSAMSRHTMKGIGEHRHDFDQKVYVKNSPEIKRVFHGSYAWTSPETWGESFAKNVGWTAGTVGAMIRYPAWITAYYSTLFAIPAWRKLLETKNIQA